MMMTGLSNVSVFALTSSSLPFPLPSLPCPLPCLPLTCLALAFSSLSSGRFFFPNKTSPTDTLRTGPVCVVPWHPQFGWFVQSRFNPGGFVCRVTPRWT